MMNCMYYGWYGGYTQQTVRLVVRLIHEVRAVCSVSQSEGDWPCVRRRTKCLTRLESMAPCADAAIICVRAIRAF